METLQYFIGSIWQAITPLEAIGFGCALVYSLLASYEKVWCWPFAIISTGIFTYMFFADNVKLQGSLQLFYLLMAAYGWYEWTYGKKDAEPLHITSFPLNKLLLVLLIGIPFTVAGGLLNQHYNADMPFLDSAITIYSLIGTWMMAKKIIQNWFFWMVIDPFSIWFFAERGRYLIAFLFFIYTLIAIFGYFKWRKEMNVQQKAFA